MSPAPFPGPWSLPTQIPPIYSWPPTVRLMVFFYRRDGLNMMAETPRLHCIVTGTACSLNRVHINGIYSVVDL